MKMIPVTIRDKIAVAPPDAEYICGNSDFVVNFDFDAEWAAHETKTARFVYNGTFTDVIFTGNQCSVPVISDTKGIKIGVYAGNLQTTTPAYINAKKSILCGGGLPADPAPDVYAQLMEQLNSVDGIFVAEYNKTTYAELQKAWSDGKYIVVNHSGSLYALWYVDKSYFAFQRPQNINVYYCKCTSSNVWTIYSNNYTAGNHASKHSKDGSDPITPADIGAVDALGESIGDPNVNIDELTLTKCYLCGSTVISKGLKGDLPFTSSFLLKVEDFTGTGTRSIQTAIRNVTTKAERKWRLWNGHLWSQWWDD